MELPHDYPNDRIPFLRVKNLSPDYLDNNYIDNYETEIRKMAREGLGGPVLFEVADWLREQICDINEGVLGKFEDIMKKKEEKEKEEHAGMVFSATEHLNYTPVNKETFGAWCETFLAQLKEQEDKNITEQDLRKTGKELFLEMHGDIEDLQIEE